MQIMKFSFVQWKIALDFLRVIEAYTMKPQEREDDVGI